MKKQNVIISSHSYYSLKYGVMSEKEVLEEAEKHGFKTVALTDINNTSACLNFVRIAERYNIRPIIGVDFRNGFGDLVDKLQNLPSEKRVEIERDINDTFENNANLAMVDSEKGITNLHVPSDVIIDASMPAMIRTSGKMWNRDNKTEDIKAIIPDSSYASIYSATIDFCIFDYTSLMKPI